MKVARISQTTISADTFTNNSFLSQEAKDFLGECLPVVSEDPSLIGDWMDAAYARKLPDAYEVGKILLKVADTLEGR